MSLLRVPVRSTDHIQGSPNAPVTIVEYGDYECPFSGMAHPIVKQVQRHFAKRLCFAYRHFPLMQVHPQAHSAAETAEFDAAPSI
jgi:protein-disulfide isomerase